VRYDRWLAKPGRGGRLWLEQVGGCSGDHGGGPESLQLCRRHLGGFTNERVHAIRNLGKKHDSKKQRNSASKQGWAEKRERVCMCGQKGKRGQSARKSRRTLSHLSAGRSQMTAENRRRPGTSNSINPSFSPHYHPCRLNTKQLMDFIMIF